ncbi:unnamed protein product [Lampetra fluviatilis]
MASGKRRAADDEEETGDAHPGPQPQRAPPARRGVRRGAEGDEEERGDAAHPTKAAELAAGRRRVGGCGCAEGGGGSAALSPALLLMSHRRLA